MMLQRVPVGKMFFQGAPRLLAAGVTIELPDMLAETCIQDSMADNIDALLCTMQAAWAYSQRTNGYGIPLKCNKVEGWIVDPGLADPLTY